MGLRWANLALRLLSEVMKLFCGERSLWVGLSEQKEASGFKLNLSCPEENRFLDELKIGVVVSFLSLVEVISANLEVFKVFF